MSEQVDWAEFQRGDGDFPEPFKFENPGDTIAGTITRMRVATIDGKRIPEFYIQPDDGDERSVLAGQVRLQIKLAELRPASGDRIAIVFTGTEAGSKPGRTLKNFDVQHKRGTATAAPSSAADLI